MQEKLVPALQSALSSVSLLRRDATLLAAVSGGMDSVALLYALAQLRPEVGFRLHACHVNHGLRGPQSDKDHAFVSELCEQLGVPLLAHHALLLGDMQSAGVEDMARRSRQAFFLRAMCQVRADALLLAHHQDDQAETVLMRLMRGAGALGLGGMRDALPFGPGVLLRPFLSLSRQSIRESMEEGGLSWREDESNGDPCCLRNRLRLQIMPALEHCQPQTAPHLAQTAQRLQWDEDCLHALAAELLERAQVRMPFCYALSSAPLRETPKAILLRVLRMWAMNGMLLAQQDEGASLFQGERSLSHQDSLRLCDWALGLGPSSLNLPKGLQAHRAAGYLHLLRQGGLSLLPPVVCFAQPLCETTQAYRLGPHAFSLRSFEEDRPDHLGSHALLLTEAVLSQGLCFRFPEPGDEIHPFGAPGHKALRRYFTDRKVSAPFRPVWPLLAQGSHVLWVPGVGAAQSTCIPPDAKPLWILRLESELPYPSPPREKT